jgi:predicted DCC family thiol-disulfide oxidoreductase YuxK
MDDVNKDIPVIFYDGECGFCNSTIQFILNKKKRVFNFAALQSDYARRTLEKINIPIQMDTIYFLKNGKVYSKSSAAFQISKGLKGLYPILIVFYIIPRFIRDAVYNAIAKRRHRIRNGYCMIPSEADKNLFLDD